MGTRVRVLQFTVPIRQQEVQKNQKNDQPLAGNEHTDWVKPHSPGRLTLAGTAMVSTPLWRWVAQGSDGWSRRAMDFGLLGGDEEPTN